MTVRRVAGRILIVLVAALMLLLSATFAWAAVVDYQSRGLVPKGVTVVGHDLSGMNEAQARAVIEEAVSTPMLRPIVVSGDGKTWTLDAKGIVKIDVDAMIQQAFEPRRTATYATRVSLQVTGEPFPTVTDIKPVYSVDATAVTSWVGRTAKEVNRQPKNATRTLVKYAFVVTPEVPGAKVNQVRSADEIAKALTADAALSSASRAVTLTVSAVKPKVLQTSFKNAIVVSLSERRVRLYNGGTLVKAYSCAIGMPNFPTPTGDFVIELKRYMPTWVNPGGDWAKTMPPTIAPGVNNPLGTRALNISASGIRFHGIPDGENWSVGEAASHGCMRMHQTDIEDFYPRVEVGTPVYIRE